MPIKSIEVMGTPGIVRDSPFHKINPAAFSDGQNVRFNQNGAESLSGDREVFSASPTSPIWLHTFPPITAPKWVYATESKVYVIDGASHTEITRASGDYSASLQERWHATVFNGVGILNNTIDIPQVWNPLDAGTQLIDLPNWDSTRRAKVLRTFRNFLVALNMTDSSVNRPYRVLWSDSADVGTVPGSWNSTDPATDSREFDLAQTPDYLVDCLPLGAINIVYKEKTTWAMSFVGAPFYFRFDQLLSSRGLLHRDCVTAIPMGHCVVTQDDIIVHTGQVNSDESIVDKVLRNWLFASIDPTNFRNSFLVTDIRRNEVYFCFPEIGETYANRALIWNWKDASLGIRDLTPTPFMTSGPVGDSLIDDLAWG